MPHPVYGDPQHPLERVVITITVPRKVNDRRTHLEAYGWSSGKRSSLWHLREEWDVTETRGGYEASDMAHHIAMVALQDHPTSQAQMDACLIGEGWTQLTLDI